MTIKIRHRVIVKSLRSKRLFDKGMLCIIVTYITIFILASTILITSLRYSEPQSLTQNTLPANLYETLSKVDIAHFDVFGWPHKTLNIFFNCSTLSEAKYSLLASGWTKSIYKLTLNNKSYALKMFNPNGEGMTRCLATDNFQNCHTRASSKLIREFILSQELSHDHIIKVLGWCIMDFNFVMVTELCQPLNTLNFLTMDFANRLKVSLHAARLLDHLSKSSVGALGLVDFRKEQFVLCNDKLTLTDLDDISLEDPRCNEKGHCQMGECKNNVCEGHNTLKNIQLVLRDIVNLTVAYDTPVSLRPKLSKLLSNPTAMDSAQLVSILETVCNKLQKINHASM